MEFAKAKVVKVDSVSNTRLAGAVFGIYSDEACRNLIVTMPAPIPMGSPKWKSQMERKCEIDIVVGI